MRKRIELDQTRAVKATSIASAMDMVLNSPRIKQQVFSAVIADKWEDIAGTAISQHVQPLSFSGGTLILQADSSVWRQQVSFMEDELKKRINEELGFNRVRTVKIR